MTTEYEWDIETIDLSTDDIEDHDFRDELACFPKPPRPRRERLVLVRHDEGGSMWAYVEHAQLPPTFEGTDVAVPARFHRELAQWQRSLARRAA